MIASDVPAVALRLVKFSQVYRRVGETDARTFKFSNAPVARSKDTTLRRIMKPLFTGLSIFTLCAGLAYSAWVVFTKRTFAGYLIVLVFAPACFLGAVVGAILGVKFKSRAAWFLCSANLLCAVGMLFVPGHAS
jgi:hypothetical protein